MKRIETLIGIICLILVARSLDLNFHTTTDRTTYALTSQVMEKEIRNLLYKEDGAYLSRKSDEISQEELLIYNSTKRLLQLNPLSDNAILFYARLRMNNPLWGQIDSDSLELALKRNPRNRGVLSALIEYSQSRNDVAALLDNVDLLYRLERDFRQASVNFFVDIYQTKEGQHLVSQRLLKNPDWGNAFWRNIINKTTPENIDKLSEFFLEYTESLPSKSSVFEFVGPICAKMILIGGHTKAKLLWDRIIKGDEADLYLNNSLNYNPNFETTSSPPPFNWKLIHHRDIVAKLDSNGLYASFSGKKSRPIIQQLFIPTQKELEVSIVAEQQYRSASGHFVLEIQCVHPVGKVINIPLKMNLDIKNASIHSLKELDGDSCELASLKIQTVRGIYSDRITARFKTISVYPVDHTQEGIDGLQ